MSLKIICIGGTGQMVLHYYMQLYLLGVIDSPFDAVVVDTDEIITSIQITRRFLQDLEYGSERTSALGADVPLVESMQVKPPRGDTALEVMSGLKDWDDATQHPSHAFFDKETLVQNLNRGLFARPGLSSVISRSALMNQALVPEEDSTLVIVGSVIGGTGGGLTAPIIDTIRMRCRTADIKNARIRAVFFGEYFPPDPTRVEGDVIRFQSNETLVLRSIREALEEVHSFHIVGGPGFDSSFERKPEEERQGENISWPKNEQNPLWEGVRCVHHLLNEATMDKKVEFEDREIEAFPPTLTLRDAQLKLKQRWHLVEKLIAKKVVVRMSQDPIVRLIWGQRLTALISHFWSIAARKEGGAERVQDFPQRLQLALETIWHGDANLPGLRNVFPILTESHKVRPRHIARIPWPDTEDANWNQKVFEGSGQAARRAAATILYWALRKGV